MNNRTWVIISFIMFIVYFSLLGWIVLSGKRDVNKTKEETNRELLLAKQAKDFQSSCMPALNQRTTIRWKQDGLFCIKQEWNGKRLIEVEVKRVETVEGFLAYPLGRKE